MQYRKLNECMKQNSFSVLTLLDNIYVFIAITALQNAKICVLCSSYYRKPLQLTEVNRKHFPLLSTRCHSKCLCKSYVHFCNVVVPTFFPLVHLELYLLNWLHPNSLTICLVAKLFHQLTSFHLLPWCIAFDSHSSPL